MLLLDGAVPAFDRGQRQRALPHCADHYLAAGHDALGDRNLSLTGEQLNRAHLTQIHAHGIVGAAKISLTSTGSRGSGGGGGGGGSDLGALFLRLLGLFIFDKVDAQLGNHRHSIFDLLGGYFFWWQNGVQLVVGDMTALAALGDQALHRRDSRIEQRAVASLFARFRLFRGRYRLFGHARSIPEKITDQLARSGTPPHPERRPQFAVNSYRIYVGLVSVEARPPAPATSRASASR